MLKQRATLQWGTEPKRYIQGKIGIGGESALQADSLQPYEQRNCFYTRYYVKLFVLVRMVHDKGTYFRTYFKLDH